MKIKKLFEKFNEINDILGGHLTEISVKQHQITFLVQESLLEAQPLMELLNSVDSYTDSFITTRDDVLYISIGRLSLDSMSKKDILYPFVYIITSFAQKICTCPSLEFIVAKEYIKCFLDKPGLKISDLKTYEDILGVKGKGELELHPQRPYLLFINENIGE